MIRLARKMWMLPALALAVGVPYAVMNDGWGTLRQKLSSGAPLGTGDALATLEGVDAPAPPRFAAEVAAIDDFRQIFRFDVSAPAPAAAEESEAPTASERARRFVSETVSDSEAPVVMFALEWCEFCWSMRKLFARCDIPYRSVDLDSVEYQEDDWGGQIRTCWVWEWPHSRMPPVSIIKISPRSSPTLNVWPPVSCPSNEPFGRPQRNV